MHGRIVLVIDLIDSLAYDILSIQAVNCLCGIIYKDDILFFITDVDANGEAVEYFFKKEYSSKKLLIFDTVNLL